MRNFSDPCVNLMLRLNKDLVLDQRVYNDLTTKEVVVIWDKDSTTSATVGPHITIHGKEECEHRIMHYYGCYDPLQYPLLRPYGDCRWHHKLRKRAVVVVCKVPLLSRISLLH